MPDKPANPANVSESSAQTMASFESALSELESLVAQMEAGELTLEASLEIYQKGLSLSKVCQDHLAQAEQKVRVLEADLLKPFSGEGSTPRE